MRALAGRVTRLERRRVITRVEDENDRRLAARMKAARMRVGPATHETAMGSAADREDAGEFMAITERMYAARERARIALGLGNTGLKTGTTSQPGANGLECSTSAVQIPSDNG